MIELTIIQKIAIWALPLLFAITLHEVAHGLVAYLLGDLTAKLSGRLTLNPVQHIDLVGTIIIPVMMLMMGGFIFGWAKPVPVDARNLHHPRRDMALVALAGPLSNLIMAFGWGLIAKFGLMAQGSHYDYLGVPLMLMGSAGIMINIVLGVLNLIPIPPLDGGRVLMAILPPRLAYSLSFLEPYGFFILLLLLVTGALSFIMTPFVLVLMDFIRYVFGV